MSTDALVIAKAEVAPEAQETQGALAFLKSFEITTDAEFEWLAELAQKASARYKEVDERRKSLTGPLRQVIKGIDDLFRGVLQPLDDSKATIKIKLANYTNRKEAERIAVMQASAALHAAGGTPTAIIPEPPKANGISVRRFWSFRITNPDHVPRELCSPDESKIQQAIWYADTPRTPPRPIAGVEFFLADQVTVRQTK